MNQLTTLIVATLMIVGAIISIHKKRTFGGLFLALLLIVLANSLSFMNLIVKPKEESQENPS